MMIMLPVQVPVRLQKMRRSPAQMWRRVEDTDIVGLKDMGRVDMRAEDLVARVGASDAVVSAEAVLKRTADYLKT